MVKNIPVTGYHPNQAEAIAQSINKHNVNGPQLDSHADIRIQQAVNHNGDVFVTVDDPSNLLSPNHVLRASIGSVRFNTEENPAGEALVSFNYHPSINS